jgi:hypothetical protein
MLQPAPADWVAKAQRAIAGWLASSGPVFDLTALTQALERDLSFRHAFDADPVAAAEAAGWPDLARALEREVRALIALAERIAAEGAFRAQLDADPMGTLEAAFVPRDAAEPFLHALAVPDDLLRNLPEVVAHQQDQDPFRTRLLILLLGAAGIRESLQNRSRRA